MRALTQQNALITPATPHQIGVKNFITLDIDEFLIGSSVALPISEEGGFVVWINHQSRIEKNAGLRDNKTFLFYVMKQYQAGNFEAEEAARILTEKAAHAFVNRMANDSRTEANHNFWEHGFDLPVANFNPMLMKRTGATYVGWMIDFQPSWVSCLAVKPDEWHDINP